MEKILNIAVVAHVDVGKSTLVDALLEQTNSLDKDTGETQIMDSNDLEKERGITIYSKNCSIKYKDYKINIVDTPGHADFSSEVERIIKTVDTVVLLVDSKEGVMPQTRFVLNAALKQNLNPILFINKIDKPDARVDDVINMTFDLFVELNATDKQLDFPICYGIAKKGIAKKELEDTSDNIYPLLDTIIENTESLKGDITDPLRMQISSLYYDDYLGRGGVGRVSEGLIKKGQSIAIVKNNKEIDHSKINKILVNEGINKKEVNEARYGDIVTIFCSPDIEVGDTVCDKDHINPMDPIEIEKPTLSMNFLVNSSPFAGRSGKFLTNRHIKERLDKELETNVGLMVEELSSSDGFKVSGRGELHLSILLENMRREGYELSVSKPEVLYKEINGEKCEPFEEVLVSLPNEYAGTIINDLNERKGILQSMTEEEGHTKLEYLVPTRGLIGYRSNFITNTKGEGIMVRRFNCYKPYAGEIRGRKNGVLVSMEDGKTMAYSLFNLSDRGQMIVGPSVDVYKGMIIGINNRDNDLNVNPCKNKQLTNTRAAGSDEALTLIKPRVFTLEEALEFIESDELVEITPDSIRLRKKILDDKERYRMRNNED